MQFFKAVVLSASFVATVLADSAPGPARCDLVRVFTSNPNADPVPMIMQAADGTCFDAGVCCLHPDGPVFKSLVATGKAHG